MKLLLIYVTLIIYIITQKPLAFGELRISGRYALQDFFDLIVWNGNTVLDYLIFSGSFAASFIVILIFKRVILKRIAARAEKTPSHLDDIIVHALQKYLVPLLYIGALYLNTKWLALSVGAAKAVNIIALACVIILGASVISAVLVYFFNRTLEKKQDKTDKFALRWIGIIIKAVVWICALLLFLDNIGVKITALIAGLGIGGIAVAFAAQAILEDVFSFITIFFDRPFEIDDFIIVDDFMGTVEQVGIKTTRLRSINGEQLIFSNKDLTNSRVRNYKRMENRRVVFSLGVTYSTPLKEIPLLIKNIVESVGNTTFDRAHFKEFGESSLKFEASYYVLSQDFNLYMDVQQSINFAIKEEFEKRGIEFAFPARTLYMQNENKSRK